MRPRMLSVDDVSSTEAALGRFYRNRPSNYGLEEHGAADYDAYSLVVGRYASRPDLPCIDLGCGTHHSPVALSKQGFASIVGLDLFSDADLRRFSSEIAVAGVVLQSYDGARLPFESESVGTVTSLCVLEHVPRVNELLLEIDRVLVPGGSVLIVGPNWSGPSSPVRALVNLRRGSPRYWQFETISDCAFGVVRSISWWVGARLTRRARFILIRPRFDTAGEIDFEFADDDAVHLCQPLSFKYWFEARRYLVRSFNRDAGSTSFARLFNRWFPGLATTNMLAFEKPTRA